MEADYQRPQADEAAVVLFVAAAAAAAAACVLTRLEPQLRPHSNKVLGPWHVHRTWP
jgi:hypothetical protein